MRGERARGKREHEPAAWALAFSLLATVACAGLGDDAPVDPAIEADAAAPDARVLPDAGPDQPPPPPDVEPASADAAAPDTAAPDKRPPPSDARMPEGLDDLSDDFCADHLDPSWSVLNAGKVDVSVRGCALHLVPTQSLLWFNGSTGALVSKRVTGDFKVTSTVRSRKRTNFEEPVTNKIHLGGLMARSPLGGRENYVFIGLGVDVNDHSIETKTTVDGSSTYAGPAWAPRDAELRMCRLGNVIYLYKRALKAAGWTPAAEYFRADLPPTLQVGPIAYATADHPDLDVAFDAVEFAAAPDLAACTRD